MIFVLIALLASVSLWGLSAGGWKDVAARSGKATALWVNTAERWARAERMWAYSERLWQETNLIHLHARGEWSPCGTCGQKIPRLALRIEADGIPTCARCSPEAKAAGRFVGPSA